MADWRVDGGVSFESTIDATEGSIFLGATPGLGLTGANAEAQVEERRRRRSFLRQTLLTADVIGLLGACIVGVLSWKAGSPHRAAGLASFLVAMPVWLAGAAIVGLYDRDDERPGHSTLDDFGRIFQLSTVAVWSAALVRWRLAGDTSLPPLLLFWFAALSLPTCGRMIARTTLRHRASCEQNTIIVGAGEVGQLIGRKLVQHPEFGLRLLGFVDSDPLAMRRDLDSLPVLGSPSDIDDIVRRHRVDRVIVAFSNDRHEPLVHLVRSLRHLSVQVDLVPRLFETVGPVAGVHLVEGFPLVGLPAVRPSRLTRTVKRAVDLSVALVALTLSAPLFAWIAWRIRRTSPGPVFFRQERLGEGRKHFTLLKFRTMYAGTDDAPHRAYVQEIMDSGAVPTVNNLYKLSRANDVTPFGAWLRRTSLDELPQLVNVIRGDMSLVGPRPCIEYETGLYEPHHFERFLVPAGMTGLWQVFARAHTTMKEALDLDVTYARNWSLRLDLSLLLRTPLALLRGGSTR